MDVGPVGKGAERNRYCQGLGLDPETLGSSLLAALWKHHYFMAFLPGLELDHDVLKDWVFQPIPQPLL